MTHYSPQLRKTHPAAPGLSSLEREETRHSGRTSAQHARRVEGGVGATAGRHLQRGGSGAHQFWPMESWVSARGADAIGVRWYCSNTFVSSPSPRRTTDNTGICPSPSSIVRLNILDGSLIKAWQIGWLHSERTPCLPAGLQLKQTRRIKSSVRMLNSRKSTPPQVGQASAISRPPSRAATRPRHPR